MLSGKEKAQLLLAALGSESKVILSRLSEESVTFLTGSIEGAPDATISDYKDLLSEINERVMDKSEDTRFSGLSSLDVDDDDTSVDDVSELDEADGELDEVEDDEISDLEDGHDANIVENSESEDVSVEESESGPKMRNPVEITALLEQQPAQLAAFIFSKLSKQQQLKVSEFSSESLQMTLELTKVEKTPMDEKVFAAIYDDIFMPEEVSDLSIDDELDV